MEDFIVKAADFLPKLSYFFAVDWYSLDEVEFWEESGRSTGKLMDDACQISLSMLKKAIKRRGFGAEIVFDHGSNGDDDDDDDDLEYSWRETKQYNPVYKIDDGYYLFGFKERSGELVFESLDHWLAGKSTC